MNYILVIKDTQMPLGCENCFAYDDDTKIVPFCRITKDQVHGVGWDRNRISSCPLINVSDADGVLDYIRHSEALGDCESFIQHFMD